MYFAVYLRKIWPFAFVFKRYITKLFISQQQDDTCRVLKAQSKCFFKWVCFFLSQWCFTSFDLKGAVKTSETSGCQPTLGVHLISHLLLLLLLLFLLNMYSTINWGKHFVKKKKYISMPTRLLCSLNAVFIQTLDWFLPPKLVLDYCVSWLRMCVIVSSQRENKKKTVYKYVSCSCYCSDVEHRKSATVYILSYREWRGVQCSRVCVVTMKLQSAGR